MHCHTMDRRAQCNSGRAHVWVHKIWPRMHIHAAAAPSPSDMCTYSWNVSSDRQTHIHTTLQSVCVRCVCGLSMHMCVWVALGIEFLQRSQCVQWKWSRMATQQIGNNWNVKRGSLMNVMRERERERALKYHYYKMLPGPFQDDMRERFHGLLRRSTHLLRIQGIGWRAQVRSER